MSEKIEPAMTDEMRKYVGKAHAKFVADFDAALLREIGMGEKIEPALRAEEWEEYRKLRDYGWSGIPVTGASTLIDSLQASEAGSIAIANDLLPDSDRRKITREKIAMLRKAVAYLEAEYGAECADDMWDWADALESYIPPDDIPK